MTTINLHNSSFQVRENIVNIIKGLKAYDFRNIQEMLVALMEQLEDIHTDEYALAVAVYFPDSKAWGEGRQGRCVTDVRKYNKGEFKCQGGVAPDCEIKALDAGTRQTKRDETAALTALAAIEEQLS